MALSKAPLLQSRLFGACLVLTCAATLLGCPSIPDPVPYEARIGGSKDFRGIAPKLVGGDLYMDGKKVGRVKPVNTAVSNVLWKGRKARLRKVMGAKFTLKLKGACGKATFDLDGPPERWKNMTDSELAETIDNLDTLNLFLDVTESLGEHHILIDWGDSSAKSIKIGKTKVKRSDKNEQETIVYLKGCDKGPKVRVGDKSIGRLDPSAAAHLISLDKERCHNFREIVYGNARGQYASASHRGRGVMPLPVKPSYRFESAPLTLSVYEGTKGASMTELVQTPCR